MATRYSTTHQSAPAPYTTHIHPEPKRDWAAWLLSGHRLCVITYLVGGIIVLYAIQTWLWPQGRTPQTLLEVVSFRPACLTLHD